MTETRCVRKEDQTLLWPLRLLKTHNTQADQQCAPDAVGNQKRERAPEVSEAEPEPSSVADGATGKSFIHVNFSHSQSY